MIIVDAGIASLVSVWLESICRASPTGHGKPLLWRPAGLGPAASGAIDALAERCHQLTVIQGRAPLATTGLEASAMLLGAGEAAMVAGCTRLIWPLQLGGGVNDDARLTLMSQATDRALLAARLLCVDAPVPGLLISTPLLDLTDEQLLDLAADADAPIAGAWWCASQSPQPGGMSAPCGACASCERWLGACRAAGVVPALAGLPASLIEGKQAVVTGAA